MLPPTVSQLYRVNVLLQPPNANELLISKPPFFVLRRYSQFRQLFLDLKAQLPEIMRQPSLQPPPRHAFVLSTSKELLDKRRVELERWMWRLISQPEVSRHKVCNLTTLPYSFMPIYCAFIIQ